MHTPPQKKTPKKIRAHTHTNTLAADGPALDADMAPSALALSDDGLLLFVADSAAHVVRSVNLATGIISTVAGVPFLGAYAGDGALGSLL